MQDRETDRGRNSARKVKKMNKIRRKQLDELISQIEEIESDLEWLMEDEAEYRDNMPENLQGSERYETADSACDSMSYALDNLHDAIENIEDAQG